jgi:hypothetical protein
MSQPDLFLRLPEAALCFRIFRVCDTSFPASSLNYWPVVNSSLGIRNPFPPVNPYTGVSSAFWPMAFKGTGNFQLKLTDLMAS